MEAFRSGHIPGFDAYTELRSEVKYGQGSRADLLLQGAAGRVFVEVKSVTLCRTKGRGAFPDAVSERGRKHLRELQAVLADDTRALLFFCVFHSGIKAVSAAGDIDPAYRDTLEEALAAGVQVLAWKADINTTGMELAEAVPFTLDPR
jgi:sugar fermentation stimulation protein A